MKKYLLITMYIIVGFVAQLKSQNYNIRWEKGADFPLNLSEIEAITCKDKIYVIGGKITNSTTDFSKNENVDFNYEYNPKNGEWTKRENMSFKDYDVALAKVNDKIFAIGSKMAMYNPTTDTWQIRKSLEDGKAHLQGAVVNEKIYMFGFFECSRPNKTMMYDPQTDIWTEMSPIPTAGIAPTVIVYNDKIYVIGGTGLKENGRLDFSKQLQRINVYDPKSDFWEIKKPMPDYLLGAKCVLVKDNKIYFINIKSIDNKLKDNTYIYHPDTESWKTTSINLPANWYDSEGIAILNDKIYLIGGHDSKFKQHNDVFIGTIEKND